MPSSLSGIRAKNPGSKCKHGTHQRCQKQNRVEPRKRRFRDVLTNLFVSTAGCNFLVFFDNLYRKWGSPCRSTQEESDKMYTPWDPSIHNNDTTLYSTNCYSASHLCMSLGWPEQYINLSLICGSSR
eukprot:scaffold248409_cov63-Cyclotella_meneghiniana.AAC.3